MPVKTAHIPWTDRMSGWIHMAVGSAAVVAVIIFGIQEDLSWAWLATAIVAIAIAAVTRWPYGAIVTLVATSAMSRFFVQIGGWKARPEHLGVAVVSVVVAAWLLRSGRKLDWDALDYCVLAYVVANYIGSAFGSSSPSNTLRWALLSNLAVLPYFFIRIFVRDIETFRIAFRILLVVGVAESAYGVLCFVFRQVFGTSTGMEIGQYLGNVAAPYGSQYEPNLFGAYAGCTAVLALAVYLYERRPGYLVCAFLASFATFLSLSRGALIAFLAAVGWVLWRAHRHNKSLRAKSTGVLVAATVLVVLAVAVIGGVLRERFSDLLMQGATEQTTLTRLIEAEEAIQDIPTHPLIGNGTGSIQLSFNWSKYFSQWSDATWVGNVTIRVVHDSGIFGFGALLGFVVLLFRRTRSALTQATPERYILRGLSAGALLYAISFQATDGTILAFPWVHLGVLGSGAAICNEQLRRSSFQDDRNTWEEGAASSGP